MKPLVPLIATTLVAASVPAPTTPLPDWAEAPIAAPTPERLSEQAQILEVHADALLGRVETILLVSADLISRGDNTDPIVMHATLRRYAESVRGLRAILVVSAAGKLTVDTVNYPAPALNLGDRDYVRSAQTHLHGGAVVNPTVYGRTSGLPFVPISRPILDGSGHSIGTVIAVMNQNALFPEELDLCNTCAAAAVLDHNSVLASEPAGAAALEKAPIYSKRTGYGTFGYTPQVKLRAAWRHSDHYPITYVVVDPVRPDF